MNFMEKLHAMRDFGGERRTVGLADPVISAFAARDPALGDAIEDAWSQHRALRERHADILAMDESQQCTAIQSAYVNFYADDAVNPYVALAARGPWIITAKGAVVHDSGGYGMLGLGHAPKEILAAMSRPQVMANVMTPSFSQFRLSEALRREIGRSRSDGCPFARFLCLNSGSEAVTVAARISDINAKLLTDPGARHHGKQTRLLALKGGFHGRTDRPAQFSDSSCPTYRQHLASFRDRDNLSTVEPNNLQQLEEVFAWADANGVFFEAFFMEPVQGEGNPGAALTPEFYARARALTKAHGTLLLVDSIQAGLRCQGCLSMTDYPGFENLPAPDMETYSKALNAGQYPLSVLAMDEHTAATYKKGVYGNTMTTNPRAMDVACAVLDSVSEDLRRNIRQRGEEFLRKFSDLAAKLEGRITKVQGTGLLFSVELEGSYKACGTGSIEEYLRMHGIGVIHGGENSLRYTPHFNVTSAEVDLMVEATRDALLKGPRARIEDAA